MEFVDSITKALSTFFGFDSSVTIVGIILIVSLLVRVEFKKAILQSFARIYNGAEYRAVFLISVY